MSQCPNIPQPTGMFPSPPSTWRPTRSWSRRFLPRSMPLPTLATYWLALVYQSKISHETSTSHLIDAPEWLILENPQVLESWQAWSPTLQMWWRLGCRWICNNNSNIFWSFFLLFLFLPMMQVANSKTRLGSAVIGTLREGGLKGFLAGLAPR